MAVPEERRRVPISLLPIDAIVTLRTSSRIDVRRGKGSKPGGRFMIAGPIAIGLLALAILEILFVGDAPPFSLALRWISLVLGATLLGAWIAWRRAPGFKPQRGEGLLVSRTSLVIVDDDHVEVLPAEKIASTPSGIVYQNETIDDSFHEQAWIADLERAIKLASEDAAARESDRFRQAAARSTDAAVSSWRSARRAPILAAAGVGLAAAIFLEAGPIGASGASGRAAIAAKLEAANETATTFGDHITPHAKRAAEDAQRDAEERARQTKATHDLRYARALDGSAEDARKFLADSRYTDKEERAKALAHYQKIAEPLVTSAQEYDAVQGVILDCISIRCDRAFTQKARDKYQTLVGRIIDASKKSSDVALFLRDIENLGLDPSFAQKVKAKFLALGTKEALTGTLEDVRAYLSNHQFDDADDRGRVLARLTEVCTKAYPAKVGELAFHLGMLRKLCMTDTTVVYYEIEFGTDKDLGEKAANSFAKDLTDVAGLLATPSKITAVKAGARGANVRVSVKMLGVPKPSVDKPLTSEAPCEMTVQALTPGGTSIPGESITDKATCTTTRTFGGLSGLPDLDNE